MWFHRGALGAAIVLTIGALGIYLSASRDAPVGDMAGSVSRPVDARAPGSRPNLLPAFAPVPRPAPNVYAAITNGVVSPAVANLPARVYVPDSNANTLDVIDPASFRVVARYYVGAIPHHVTPAWDLHELYVDDEGGSSLGVIEPATGQVTRSIPVPYPYNLYFTPDGRLAIVVVERLSRLDFRDPKTWQLIKSVYIPWRGVDHLDFSADGSYLLASTEWSGMVVKIDLSKLEIVGTINVGGLPIDVRLSPDGSVFYVTNQGRHGVSVVDGARLEEIAFLPTGRGAHGLQVSHDARFMYVSNRDAGSISVIDLGLRQLVATWNIGGSPDMLQLSPDGRQLWATGRYSGSVYVVSTETGGLLATIPVGAGAHGLTYFPNVGLHSLGHNGVYR
jgi:YVTN family beta-propeller protein